MMRKSDIVYPLLTPDPMNFLTKPKTSCVLASLLFFFVTNHIKAAEEVPIIRTELLSVCINGDVDDFHYLNNGKPAVLQGYMAGMGSPISYRGPRRIMFFKQASDLTPPKDGPPPVPLCVADMPDENRVLLIFSFGGPKNTKPSVRAVGASTDRIKSGDYRVFNFSKQDVGVIFADQKAGLAPGKDTLLSSALWREKVADIGVQFAVAEGKVPKRVYSSMWGHRPERRMFVFLFDRGDANRPLDVRKTYDVPGIAAIPVNASSEEKAAP